MKNAQLANLEKKMQEWIEENCEEFSTYWCDHSAELMAKAAATVVDGMEDLTEYLYAEKLIGA